MGSEIRMELAAFELELQKEGHTSKDWMWLFIEAEEYGEEGMRLWRKYAREARLRDLDV